MSKLSCGIVGLPNVGKSTLFNALIKKQAASASNYPFCTIDPNVGVVDVDDSRLRTLSQLSKSKKIIYASTTFVDIAGLVQGASQGEGLGNKFLTNIRETDAILHVVRCFDDPEIIHVAGKVDPLNDITIINLELVLADLQMAENSIEKIRKQAKSNKELQHTVSVMEKVIAHLNQGLPVRSLLLSTEDTESLKGLNFITAKPVIYVMNVAEGDWNNPFVKQVESFAKNEGSQTFQICARLEEELASLSPDDALLYLKELGMEQTGLDRLIKTVFYTLGLITYITTGDIETRAWTVRAGATAPVAAGEIHSDIQKGFIRAEVVSFDDMVTYGGRTGAKEAGKARAEGKEYIVKDGDVILFFHN
ncbi:MAG: redox-regulated ATPase YchF [Simkaniaceae bacterium]|nr:redox-regulated ATPase YchF [Simkaniaceae bacterium]